MVIPNVSARKYFDKLSKITYKFLKIGCRLQFQYHFYFFINSLIICYETFIYLFIYLFTTLFNVGQTIVARLIKTNLTKTNTDIIDKNFKIFNMQHKNSEPFVHDSISV